MLFTLLPLLKTQAYFRYSSKVKINEQGVWLSGGYKKCGQGNEIVKIFGSF